MLETCQHCGCPDKANWAITCRWLDQNPEQAAAGFDPPCAITSEDGRRIAWWFFGLLLALAVMAALFAFGLARRAHAQIAIPSACAGLAARHGLPAVLTRPQAAQAVAVLRRANSGDAEVKRCIAAVFRRGR